uniref:NAC domain-containing protein n=1 Tax=Setaria viridis TaxID=4556 RepID=A0A4U6UCW5_SETVI|nr:hypothetical protein SEVIR_5G071600v2 [Setaria viridis]
MGGQKVQPKGMSIKDGLQLPPGFRFYPSDEEIITFYLKPKVHQSNFSCTAIGEVDLNRIEPWELSGKAKMGDKEWYFFYLKDRKYPTGKRTNRATKGGYWKATGKDREIYRAAKKDELPLLVGMKKTLVFYKGRAPTGKKTDWVMHEFRLEGTNKVPCPASSSTSTTTIKSSSSEDEWVVCRVFDKTTRVKREPALPLFNVAMTGGGIDQSSISMPMPLQFSMLSDFTMDPAASYYSTVDARSLAVPPVMPPLSGMGNIGLQVASTLFGNSMVVAPPMSIYHQMGMGAEGASSFLGASKSGPSLMVSQKDTGVDHDQANADEISQMISANPESVATKDMDGIWKY